VNPPLARRYVRLAPEHTGAVALLFEREGLACHCRYWHFPGDKNAWLARCAFEPEANRAEFALAAEEPALHGIVALGEDDAAIGWMKLTTATALPKLYSQRLYRNLACFGGDRTGVMTIGCFLVDSRFRRQGVARELLRAGIAEARALGARAIEAFPRRAEGVSDAELWLGPSGLFVEQGFEVVHDFAPYPVLKLEL
jgi:GNAT superfamily N-acetyltransferase